LTQSRTQCVGDSSFKLAARLKNNTDQTHEGRERETETPNTFTTSQRAHRNVTRPPEPVDFTPRLNHEHHAQYWSSKQTVSIEAFIQQFAKYFNSLRKVDEGREIHLNLGLPKSTKPEVIDEQWDPEGAAQDLKEILGLEATVTHFRPATMQDSQYKKKWMTVAEITLVIPKGFSGADLAVKLEESKKNDAVIGKTPRRSTNLKGAHGGEDRDAITMKMDNLLQSYEGKFFFQIFIPFFVIRCFFSPIGWDCKNCKVKPETLKKSNNNNNHLSLATGKFAIEVVILPKIISEELRSNQHTFPETVVLAGYVGMDTASRHSIRHAERSRGSGRHPRHTCVSGWVLDIIHIPRTWWSAGGTDPAHMHSTLVTLKTAEAGVCKMQGHPEYQGTSSISNTGMTLPEEAIETLAEAVAGKGQSTKVSPTAFPGSKTHNVSKMMVKYDFLVPFAEKAVLKTLIRNFWERLATHLSTLYTEQEALKIKAVWIKNDSTTWIESTFMSNLQTHVAYINTGDNRWTIDDTVNFVFRHTSEIPLAVTAAKFADIRPDVPWYNSSKVLSIQRVLLNPSIKSSDAIQDLFSSNRTAMFRDEAKAAAATFTSGKPPFEKYHLPMPIKIMHAVEVTRTLGSAETGLYTLSIPKWGNYTCNPKRGANGTQYGPLETLTDAVAEDALLRKTQAEKMKAYGRQRTEVAREEAIVKAVAAQQDILNVMAEEIQTSATEMQLKTEGKTDEEIAKIKNKLDRRKPAVATVVANTKAFKATCSATSIPDPEEIKITIRDPYAGMDDIIAALQKNPVMQRKVGTGTNASFMIHFKANNYVSQIASDTKEEEQATSIAISDMTKITPGDPGIILIQVLPKTTPENEAKVKEHMEKYARKAGWLKNKKGAVDLKTPETKNKASPMKIGTNRAVRQKLDKGDEMQEGESMEVDPETPIK